MYSIHPSLLVFLGLLVLVFGSQSENKTYFKNKAEARGVCVKEVQIQSCPNQPSQNPSGYNSWFSRTTKPPCVQRTVYQCSESTSGILYREEEEAIKRCIDDPLLGRATCVESFDNKLAARDACVNRVDIVTCSNRRPDKPQIYSKEKLQQNIPSCIGRSNPSSKYICSKSGSVYYDTEDEAIRKCTDEAIFALEWTCK